MASPVILQKLNSIARCLERLEEKKPSSLEKLKNDLDCQDILMLNLERLVQLSVDAAAVLIAEKNWSPIPATMAESFDVLHAKEVIPATLCARMKKSVGFRNIAVHEYDKINWEIVYKIVTKHLGDFKKFAKALEKFGN